MKSAKCANCGFVGWSDAEVCKKCGESMCAALDETADRPADNFSTFHSNYVTVPAEPRTGLAITSLVMGILNFVFLGIFLIPTVVGIIISAVALNKINRYPNEYGGKPMAVAGLVTNIVSIVLMIPVLLIASISIPNVLAARRAANESAALKALRTIHGAEQTYQATYGDGSYGTLEDLQRHSLISADLARGVRWGYRWKVEVVPPSSGSPAAFEVVAVPTEYGSSGRRSFFVDETGVLRGEDRQGVEANKYTPPINLNRGYPERQLDNRRVSSYADDE